MIRIDQAEQVAVVGSVQVCLHDLEGIIHLTGGQFDRFKLRFEDMDVLRAYPGTSQEFGETLVPENGMADEIKSLDIHFREDAGEIMGLDRVMENVPGAVPHAAAVYQHAEFLAVLPAPVRHHVECRQVALDITADVE